MTAGNDNGVMLSTTPTLQGYQIEAYRGIVVGEAVLGADIVKDLFASVRDIVGGRSESYENELYDARELALKELAQEAASRGANAVVGVDLDYEVMGSGGSIIMVSANGTAVSVVKT